MTAWKGKLQRLEKNQRVPGAREADELIQSTEKFLISDINLCGIMTLDTCQNTCGKVIDYTT